MGEIDPEPSGGKGAEACDAGHYVADRLLAAICDIKGCHLERSTFGGELFLLSPIETCGKIMKIDIPLAVCLPYHKARVRILRAAIHRGATRYQQREQHA